MLIDYDRFEKKDEILESVTLTPQEYKALRNQHPYRDFVNLLKAADLKKINHWGVEYVGIKKQDRVICATPLTSIPVMKLYRFYYAQREFLMDYHNVEFLHFFMEELATYLREKKGLCLVVDPNVLYKERDIDGKLMENDFNHSCVVDSMVASEYRHQGFTKDFQVISKIRWVSTLYLDGKDESTLLEEMHQQVRWSVDKTLKQGIQVRELSIDELDIFLDMMHHTSQRCEFAEREPEFYRNQMTTYDENAELLLAYLDLSNFHRELDLEKQGLEEKHAEILAKLEELPNSKKFIKKKKVLDEVLALSGKKYRDAGTLEQGRGTCIPVATSSFVQSQDELIYPCSTAYNAFKKYNAPYAIQQHMLQCALRHGIREYNFYGLSGGFDKNAQDYGVYEFKKGFHSVVEKLVNDFILPIQKEPYALYKKLKNK